MTVLVSPDKKIEIPTENPTEIVRLKAEGFTVKPGTDKPTDKPASTPAKSTK
ncbi:MULTISPECIES: hypothetical protein [Glutamicibacter]|uniref:Uncharacterized protein n=1 Tax=Glutamicibacter protophormiae TaxID=37930 RepID=A0ABS4XQX9_GLUPR|nr:hypothetical protein [Glutamicibacter protophormiae]MBP2398909.1 hypothetical protein [Glutamicibacter protophormiae]GGL83506.1 hypothetical protein GCM10010038_11770 [Glutamicibacter protophormiae]